MTRSYPASALDLDEPIGQIVDVGGRAVHVVEMGQGSPRVWLENGWLGTTLGWGCFQHKLAEHTCVCAYDRAGIAWSDPVDSNRSAQIEANEFVALLDALGENEPVILLAWSGGGPVAQIVAADHPERVAGLILMDGIPPGYDLWATQTYPNRYPRERHDHLEVIRCFAKKAAENTLTKDDVADFITPSTLQRHGERYLRLLLYNPNYWWTYYWQNQYIIASGAQVKSKGSLGDMPLSVIIASGQQACAEQYQRDLAQTWRAMQSQQARLSTRGRVLRVDAGHAVFRERPEAVIAAAQDMIAAVNAQYMQEIRL